MFTDWSTDFEADWVKTHWEIWKTVGLIEGDYPADRIKVFER